jgi:hypothetical protein
MGNPAVVGKRDFIAAATGDKKVGDINLYPYVGRVALPGDGHRLQ